MPKFNAFDVDMLDVDDFLLGVEEVVDGLALGRSLRDGPCDDDPEATTVLAWGLPEESGRPDGSPLRLR
jgi:hypothetical protein